ncbi:hypothetical protein CRYUN_Cryun37aG0118500 [Craigia yunnanensis]
MPVLSPHQPRNRMAMASPNFIDVLAITTGRKCQVAAQASLRGRKNVVINRPVTFVARTKISNSSVNRWSGNYLPCLWTDDYLQLLRSNYKGDDYIRQVEELKGKVKMMLTNVEGLLDQLELIDNLQRLGVAYHFDDEINNILGSIYRSSNNKRKRDNYMQLLWNLGTSGNMDIILLQACPGASTTLEDAKLAKLDFNILQGMHQEELKEMSRWWKNTGLGEKLSFARNRLVESFLWTVGIAFKPQFGSRRKILTKAIALITMIDDIYDVYGTLDELELFTDAVERWDIKATKQLPDYMKICFLALDNTVNEMAYDILKEQGHDVVLNLKNAYMKNAWKSITGSVIPIQASLFVTNQKTQKELEFLESYPDILYWSSVIFGLQDDLGTSSDELKRGDVAKSIQCYKHDNGISEEAAREHIWNLMREAWKKVNVHRAAVSPLSQTVTGIVLNLVRTAHCTYQHGDGHGSQNHKTKDHAMSLLFDPIPLQKKNVPFLNVAVAAKVNRVGQRRVMHGSMQQMHSIPSSLCNQRHTTMIFYIRSRPDSGFGAKLDAPPCSFAASEGTVDADIDTSIASDFGGVPSSVRLFSNNFACRSSSRASANFPSLFKASAFFLSSPVNKSTMFADRSGGGSKHVVSSFSSPPRSPIAAEGSNFSNERWLSSSGLEVAGNNRSKFHRVGLSVSLPLLPKPIDDCTTVSLGPTVTATGPFFTITSFFKFPCLSWLVNDSEFTDLLSLDESSTSSPFGTSNSAISASKTFALCNKSSASSACPFRLRVRAFLFKPRSSLWISPLLLGGEAEMPEEDSSSSSFQPKFSSIESIAGSVISFSVAFSSSDSSPVPLRGAIVAFSFGHFDSTTFFGASISANSASNAFAVSSTSSASSVFPWRLRERAFLFKPNSSLCISVLVLLDALAGILGGE